jgi:hypothetical protein
MKERLELEQSRLRASHGLPLNGEASSSPAAAATAAASGTTASAGSRDAGSTGAGASASSGGQRCNTCGGNFPDVAAYRAHFRWVYIHSDFLFPSYYTHSLVHYQQMLSTSSPANLNSSIRSLLSSLNLAAFLLHPWKWECTL